MRIRVPGDKSLTQRALILASLAQGRSRLSGLLSGGDASSTAGALRALGADIGDVPSDGGEMLVEGRGLSGFRSPDNALDLGNSGTGTRLLLGALAGSGVRATLTGDQSLRARPMARVTQPLSVMGARMAFLDRDDRLPVEVRGTRPLRPLRWDSPVASAQVKSALLLAGLTGGAFVIVTEPRRSRDHTERLFNRVGAPVVSHAMEGRWQVELRDPPARIDPLDFRVPGDPSSAAFFGALAAAGGAESSLEIEGVGLNPTRTAFLDVLRRMGAEIATEVDDAAAPEPVGTLRVAPSGLRAVDVGDDEVSGLIDEIPLVAVLATRASGVTRITGARELRHKESDRIVALVENLRLLGGKVEELDDGLMVEGSEGPLSGRVRTHGDHRIAMAFGVLGALPGNRIVVDDPAAADVSFPGFWELLGRVAGVSRT
ncbi:MAG: 3-phosphoshikimate 1-carboxyvinyltransferase [Gemmatimonadetes bacterium]|nr:3-phosphoshikimate 1-carboxyvinyltransferase [Gemmatimonadota bacterium]